MLSTTAAVAPAAANQKLTFGFCALLLYLFLLLSRMPEITATLIGTSLYQIFILTGILVFPTLFSGSFFKTIQTRIGFYLIALHSWFLVASLFSVWHGGSFQALMFVLRYFPMVFFIGGLIRSSAHLRKTFVAVVFAMMVVLAWISLNPDVQDVDRLSSEGRFSNANEIAIYFTVGGPFLVYLASSKRFPALVRFATMGVILFAVLQTLRTGSRGSLITILVLAGGCFFVVRLGTKIKLAAALAITAACSLVIIPSATWRRFLTIVDEQSGDLTGAVGSTYARKALLFESIAVTIENPLFGVGPGVYAVAAADRSKAAGLRASWQVSHNAYTQISAEAGIPALILYFLLLVAILKSLYASRKYFSAKPGYEDDALMIGCLFLAMLAYCINGFFASIGTEFYLYMFAGFGVASLMISRQVAEQVAAVPAKPVAAPPLAPPPAPLNPITPSRFGSALQRRLQQR